MLHSLRFRLLLTLIGAVALAIGSIAVFTNHVTTIAFEQYLYSDRLRNQQLFDTLRRYANEHPDLASVQSIAPEMAQILGERFVLADQNGKVLADSNALLIGQQINLDAPLRAALFVIGSSMIGPLGSATRFDAPLAPQPIAGAVGDILIYTQQMSEPLTMLPNPEQINVVAAQPIAFRRVQGPDNDPIKRAFLTTINRALLIAVLIGGLAALLLTFSLSRRILVPIERLTVAARKMEQGDRSQRVTVRSRDELGQLSHAFNAMAEGLAQADQVRRHMVSDVAHELRTPLTNIRGYLEAIRDGITHPSPALIDSLHEETMLLNHLVDDLQELALADAGQLRLQRQTIALHSPIEQALTAIQPLLAAKAITLHTNLPPELPQVTVDPARIGQILRNLLSNALTHTAPGGSILVAAQTSDEGVTVTVEDTGSGIAAEHLPFIFERFFRADRSRTRATGGAGLGLTIVKQLVEAHGGTINVRSALGYGTTFTFTLPQGTH